MNPYVLGQFRSDGSSPRIVCQEPKGLEEHLVVAACLFGAEGDDSLGVDPNEILFCSDG